jgi:hypothetical protein
MPFLVGGNPKKNPIFVVALQLVITRVSIQKGSVSMIGMMPNNPGPFNARNFPSRKTTVLSHWSATWIAEETRKATTIEPIPIAQDVTVATPP